MGALRVRGRLDENYYHVISRVVDRRFIFGDREKRQFRELMERLLRFSGLRCVTFCLMDNHFHLLLGVPDAEGECFKASATADAVFGRASELYGKERMKEIRERYEMLAGKKVVKEMKSVSVVERKDMGGRYLQTFLDRMYDLSAFMKELKGVFTQWYNRVMDRKGTLWECRFKSVICEGAGEVLRTMAAYIDLNPVRAGIVENPKDYRWCGYAEAMAGVKASRWGIQYAVHLNSAAKMPWKESAKAYQQLLLGKVALLGENASSDEKESGEGVRSISEMLRSRVRYFSDGFAIGKKAFLEGVFSRHREHFGKRRKKAGHPMRGGNWEKLMALRDLQDDRKSNG